MLIAPVRPLPSAEDRRAWSIRQVYESNGREFVVGFEMVAHTAHVLRHGLLSVRGLSFEAAMMPEVAEHIKTLLRDAESHYEAMGARASRDATRRVIESMDDKNLLFRDADVLIQSIKGAYYDELASWHVVILNEREAKIFDHGEAETFGQESVDAFPSALSHMSEACKCFALGRWRATAYHCMGVLEVGIKALCEELRAGVDFEETNVTWNKIQDKIRERITEKGHQAAPRKVSNPDTWPQDEAFFSECLLDLRNLGKAYRNTTMHFRTIVEVNENQSRRILESTASFMRYLSEKVRENT